MSLMTVNEDMRWTDIQAKAKEIAYRDEPPSELESMLCGAVVRAQEAIAALAGSARVGRIPATGETPRVDAFTSSLYAEAGFAAAGSDIPGGGGVERSPEECYSLAVELAAQLERELRALQAEVDGGAHDSANYPDSASNGRSPEMPYGPDDNPTNTELAAILRDRERIMTPPVLEEAAKRLELIDELNDERTYLSIERDDAPVVPRPSDTPRTEAAYQEAMCNVPQSFKAFAAGLERELAEDFETWWAKQQGSAPKISRPTCDAGLVREALIHFESYPPGSDQQGVMLLRRALDVPEGRRP